MKDSVRSRHGLRPRVIILAAAGLMIVASVLTVSVVLGVPRPSAGPAGRPSHAVSAHRASGCTFPPSGCEAPAAPTTPGGHPSGCVSRPSDCGYPDSTTTGWRPTGVRLKPYPVKHPVLSRKGQVIDGADIEGPVTIAAADVRITRSRIHMPNGYTDAPDHTNVVTVEGSGVIISDSEISGLGADRRQTAATVCLQMSGRRDRVSRADVNSCGDGMRGGRYVVEDSYFHKFWFGAMDGKILDTPHSDAWQSMGGPTGSQITIRHNTAINPSPPWVIPPNGAGYPNSAFMGGDEQGFLADVHLEDNLLDGGGFTINITPRSRNLVFAGNRFGRRETWGIVLSHGATVRWSRNVWDDGHAATGP